MTVGDGVASPGAGDTEDIVIPGVTVQRRWRRRLWPVPWLAGVVALVGAAAEWPSWALLALGSLGVAAIVAMVAMARAAPATLRVSAAEVRLDGASGERVLPRAAIRRALVVLGGGRVAVGIEPSVGPFLELALPTAGVDAMETAARCVERLGFGTDRRVLLFTNPTALVRTLISGVIGLCCGLFVLLCLMNLVAWGRWPMLAVVALVAWVVARSLRTTDLAVGADGIELRGPWRTRFVPFDALRRVQWLPTSMLEVAEDAKPLLRHKGTSLVDDPAMAAAFVHAAHRAKGQYDRRKRDAAITALLARRGRSLDEWRDSLRALVDVGGGYRAQALGPAELAALLGDPSAEEELRVGAALALRAINPVEEVTRIRVAAEACAHAPLRVALELAADDALDDDAMARLRPRRAGLPPR